MLMLNESVFFPKERPLLHTPTIAKITVFCGRPIEAWIKASAGKIAIVPKSNIVAREEIGVFRNPVEVLINEFEDELTSFRKKLIFKSVEGRSPDHGLRVVS